MSKIHVLREDTISKIAAGEVVERPSAIIKELFENSVDASATEIVVEVESGGKDLIRVTDNGSGIGREDADLLFARHATSKISGIGDLYSLKTMGFRGEALHSIAAVSKVVLVTKQEADSVGMRMEIMGGEMKNKSDIAALRGTMMEVTDLFYNTPVRWKFMRTTTQETRSCIEIMNKLAVANARISVTFKVDGNLVFKTDGKDDLQSTVFQVFGRSIAEDMMKLDFRNEMIAVSGLSSKFSLRKKNRNYIMTFVNGRYVKSQELTRTIEGCYRSHLMGGEFPVSFVFLEIDPSEIDVNVHPAKIEIKFADLSKVNAAITSAIKTAINAHTHVPVAYRNNAFRDERGFYESAGTLSASSSSPACTSASTLPSSISYASQEGDAKEKGVKEKGAEDICTVREASAVYEPTSPSMASCGFSHTKSSESPSESPSESSSQSMADSFARQSASEFARVSVTEEPMTESYVQQTMSETRDLFLESRFLGVFDRTYILLDYRSELYLIDQHAAHEKILYEEYTQAVANHEVSRQMLLLPFEMDMEKGAELPDLESLGFEVEPFGMGSVIVRAVPVGMSETFAKDFLRSAFDECRIGSSAYDLATKACKAAIKGGDSLEMYDIQELTRKLFSLDDPFNCPHGRPIVIKLTRREIDKLFKRIL